MYFLVTLNLYQLWKKAKSEKRKAKQQTTNTKQQTRNTKHLTTNQILGKPLFAGIGLMLSIFMFFTACQQTDYIEQGYIIEKKEAFKTKRVKLTDIPQVADFIKNKTPGLFYKSSGDKNSAIFDTDNIMEVIDTLNQTNYPFRFMFPDTPVGTFYNLVIGKTPEGELQEPYVLKYVCDSTALETYAANNFSFAYFKGKVALHRYTDFFESGYFNKGDCLTDLDENGEPIPCDEYDLDNTGPGGGGGDPTDNSNPDDDSWLPTDDPSSGSGNGSGGGSSGGGGNGCIVTTYFEPCGCGGRADGHRPSGASCCKGSPKIIIVDCGEVNKSTAKKGGDDCGSCVSPLGGVGVVAEEERVIVQNSFKAKKCLDSIYVRLEKKSSSFKNILKSFDDKFSVADLTFKADDNFKQNVKEQYYNAMAITKAPLSNNNIDIIFNSDASLASDITKQPDVIKVVAMIHEAIHANMYRKMLDAVKAANINQDNLNWRDWPNNTDFIDFIESLENKYFGIFDYSTRFEWDTTSPTSAQHQQMAQH